MPCSRSLPASMTLFIIVLPSVIVAQVTLLKSSYTNCFEPEDLDKEESSFHQVPKGACYSVCKQSNCSMFAYGAITDADDNQLALRCYIEPDFPSACTSCTASTYKLHVQTFTRGASSQGANCAGSSSFNYDDTGTTSSDIVLKTVRRWFMGNNMHFYGPTKPSSNATTSLMTYEAATTDCGGVLIPLYASANERTMSKITGTLMWYVAENYGDCGANVSITWAYYNATQNSVYVANVSLVTKLNYTIIDTSYFYAWD